MNRKIFLLAFAICWGSVAYAQEIEILKLQGEDRDKQLEERIFMLAGDGGNITVQVGRYGVLLVDSGRAEMTDKVLAAIRQVAGPPAGRGVLGKIRYIVNTSDDSDHASGNENLARAGLAAGNDSRGPAVIVAHEEVANRMAAPRPDGTLIPNVALPSNTYSGFGTTKDLFFNDEGIQIIHVPAAHSDGDSIVFFRRSDVVSTGDIFVTTGYPVIDPEKGASLQGIIKGLNLILDIAIPGQFEEDGTLIIPGHGRLCDEADVVEYRDMLTIIRERMEAMIKKGATLDQIKAARLTRDFDTEFGAGGPGGWPTDRFVEAAYKSLTQKK
jgi:glyoxylase-like metal-dependent hydrolase (beta-lactamase superfamily II)